MSAVSEQIKEQSAKYQVDALRARLNRETERYEQAAKDLQVLLNFVRTVAGDWPADVEDVVARSEERLTVKRLSL